MRSALTGVEETWRMRLGQSSALIRRVALKRQYMLTRTL